MGSCDEIFYNSLFLSFPQYGYFCLGSYLQFVHQASRKLKGLLPSKNVILPLLLFFKFLNFLTYMILFELKLLSFVYESVNRRSPSSSHDFLNFLSNGHQHHIRQASRSDIFLMRKFTLQYGLKCVRYAGAKSSLDNINFNTIVFLMRWCSLHD